MGADPLRVLFVCVGNSCRSQMAEAIARVKAGDVIAASSAGISPLGRIADDTRRVLLEQEIMIDGQFSKGVGHPSLAPADLIVNMTGIPGKSLFAGENVLDWDVADPYGEDMLSYRIVCEEIDMRIEELAGRLRRNRNAHASMEITGEAQ
jgi:arsenate reductase